MRRALALALVAVWGAVGCERPGAGNPEASAAVAEANLLANERFWPYQVALARDGSVGVLIRVEAGGVARVDFGRDGTREVPVEETDLVERANAVRLGRLEKLAPNFTLAIGPRLLDPAGDELAPLPFPAALEKRGFLCVFADPGAAELADLARALAPLSGRHGVLTILFPQGEHPDAAVRETLRGLGWAVPFVRDHLAEAYTRTLLREGTSLPALLLQTPEGRVVFQSGWRPGASAELEAALEREFARAPAQAAAR